MATSNERPLAETELVTLVDTLALALVEHDHVWTVDERKLYDRLMQGRPQELCCLSATG